MENNLLNYTKEDVVITPKEIEAVIINATIVNASTVFGSKAKDPNQKVIQVTVQNEEHKVEHVENMNYFEAGQVPDNSKLGKD